MNPIMVESMQQKVTRCIKKYPWLLVMVGSRKFYEYCDQHKNKLRCYFCCNCIIPPFCPTCNKGDHHKKHSTIQTHRSSKETGIKKETMSTYLDISGIHVYSINGFSIVYINQRLGTSKTSHRSRRQVNEKKKNNVCQVCEWEIDAASSFCSVECKFRSVYGSQLDEMMKNAQISAGNENSEIAEKENAEISVEMESSEIAEKENAEISVEMESSEIAEIAAEMESSEIVEMENTEIAAEKENSETTENSEVIEPIQKKLRRRKGCPHRSPFY